MSFGIGLRNGECCGIDAGPVYVVERSMNCHDLFLRHYYGDDVPLHAPCSHFSLYYMALVTIRKVAAPIAANILRSACRIAPKKPFD
jgi:hypothetical protein